jgi:hypothetical protein
MKVILNSPGQKDPMASSRDQGLWISVRDAVHGGNEKQSDNPDEDPGLALAKSLVQSHGGRMWTERCAAGKGNTYNFIIPLA